MSPSFPSLCKKREIKLVERVETQMTTAPSKKLEGQSLKVKGFRPVTRSISSRSKASLRDGNQSKPDKIKETAHSHTSDNSLNRPSVEQGEKCQSAQQLQNHTGK